MPGERVVKLFKNGRSQAVRIPKDMQLPGSEATIRQVGNTLVLSPVHRGWDPEFLAFLRSPPDPTAVADRNQPKQQQRRKWR